MSLLDEQPVTRMLPDFIVDSDNCESPTDQLFIGSDEFSGTLCIIPDPHSATNRIFLLNVMSQGLCIVGTEIFLIFIVEHLYFNRLIILDNEYFFIRDRDS